jgi:activator of 2-hydroxyglutaryl-CoA dehydratase/predicted nucleotide-binding protein (sugar kinase/HSP70/actin superfamily)
MGRKYSIGIDVGSTTAKAVVLDAATDQILWSDYQRHDTKQPETILAFLKRFEAEIPSFEAGSSRAFITGSGGSSISKHLGAKFVQEVNAVSLAVEKLYPECGSVVELGGQDAKIIIFKEDPETGRKRKLPSMNDKCAGGTGAVIDKVNAKLCIPAEKLCQMGYTGLKLHPVAGKCGVFAETDINGLQKLGVHADELMASLFEAIVMQNLSVLTRGNTLRPVVLLLGGPNTYIRGLQDCWKANIPKIWAERNTPLPAGVPPESLIRVPDNAQYFAAIGAVEFGKSEEEQVGAYQGWQSLEHYIEHGRRAESLTRDKGRSIAGSPAELGSFKELYRRKQFIPATFSQGEVIEGFVGIDGGSTSTKAVLLSKDRPRQVLAKVYQLSQGNPIADTIEVLGKLSKSIQEQGATLKVLGVGTTGYAKDMLRDVISADVALVETVAHTEAGLHFYKNVDVICDVGGQDIKIIVLKDGRVKDFRLNTQCSAGNGYFLQSTAQSFRVPVEQYAEKAFSADRYPEFGYGCAVFMQSDIVDFQRQGWQAEEIMAGLCNVLPKNIWLYVAQIPNLATLGSSFLLQGGTQYNLAAVKTQIDFIQSRFKGQTRPSIIVHEHCGEAGAIGAGLEAGRLWDNGRKSTFIGLEGVQRLTYTTTREEATRCHFCKNDCLRTFVDVKTDVAVKIQAPRQTKVPLMAGAQRFIIATCEKGTVEDVSEMREIKGALDIIKKEHPNLVEIAANEVFRRPDLPSVAEAPSRFILTSAQKKRAEQLRNRGKLRIGIPRVLNLYSTAPLFTGYFVSLGIKAENIVFSDFTSEELYKAGGKRGSVDPCFPSKLGIPHVHDLLMVAHAKKPLDMIFFPMIDCLPSALSGTQASRACPTVTATPAAVKAAFTKEGDLFAEKGVRFLDTFVNVSKPEMLERQMLQQFQDILGVSIEENHRAVVAGYENLARYDSKMRQRAREILDKLERENRIGIVLLGRPYHNDPGVNHGILEELQKLGYPIFTQDSLPVDEETLNRLFGEEVESGEIPDARSIADVWKNSYSENTSRKVWAAKYVARHPNLVAIELSNFKCGHDAPIYTVVEEIVEQSGTPYFCFKDIDENKPAGSIKIRIETIDYFLRRYREDFVLNKDKRNSIEEKLARYEARLRQEYMREKLAGSDAVFQQGHISTIHVPLQSLVDSMPVASAAAEEQGLTAAAAGD